MPSPSPQINEDQKKALRDLGLRLREYRKQMKISAVATAEAAGFQVFITTDRNLKYQQNLATRTIAIVVLLTTSWPRIERQLTLVVKAVHESTSAGYIEVHIE